MGTQIAGKDLSPVVKKSFQEIFCAELKIVIARNKDFTEGGSSFFPGHKPIHMFPGECRRNQYKEYFPFPFPP